MASGKSLDREIPFAGKAVAPTSRLNAGVEAGGHHMADLAGVGGGVEVEIVAEIGPVVERLHHRSGASCGLKRSGDDERCCTALVMRSRSCSMRPGSERPERRRPVPGYALQRHKARSTT